MYINQCVLEKLQKICLFLVILFMPIYNLPKAYSLPVLGGRLSFYALAVGLILWVAEGIFYKTGWNFDKKIKIFIMAVIGWKLIGLIYGLAVYPYYSSINVEQLYESSRGFRILYQITSGQVSVVMFLILKSIKQTGAEMLTTIVPAMWVYSIYCKRDFLEGYRFFRKCFVVLCAVLCFYAIPEILLFKLNLPIGEAILNVTNPYLYDVKSYLGWYPPVIWHNQQLRSLCTEPSLLGFTGAVILPFLWDLVSTKNIKAIFLYVFYIMILTMSKARTTWVVLFFEFLALFSFAIWGKKIRTVVYILLLSVIGFCVGISNWPFLGNESSNQDIEGKGKGYFAENIVSIADTKARSNGTRLLNIKSHLNVVVEKPLLGTGVGLKDLYVRDSLAEGALENAEMRGITEGIEEKGVMKYSYGNINEFVFVLTNEGIGGLFLYLCPFFYVAYRAFKRRFWNIKEVQVLLIAMGGSLASGVAGEPITALYLVLGLLYTKCID